MQRQCKCAMQWQLMTMCTMHNAVWNAMTMHIAMCDVQHSIDNGNGWGVIGGGAKLRRHEQWHSKTRQKRLHMCSHECKIQLRSKHIAIATNVPPIGALVGRPQQLREAWMIYWSGPPSVCGLRSQWAMCKHDLVPIYIHAYIHLSLIAIGCRVVMWSAYEAPSMLEDRWSEMAHAIAW